MHLLLIFKKNVNLKNRFQKMNKIDKEDQVKLIRLIQMTIQQPGSSEKNESYNVKRYDSSFVNEIGLIVFLVAEKSLSSKCWPRNVW